MKKIKRIAVLLLAALTLAACSRIVPAEVADPGIGKPEPAETEAGEKDDQGLTEPAETEGAADPAEPAGEGDENKSDAGEPQIPSKRVEIVTPASYGEVYKKITARGNNTRRYGGMKTANADFADMAVEEVMAEAPMEAPMPAPEASYAAEDEAYAGGYEGGADYSETNTQVQGVDEADIVKTDGNWIYALYDGKLKIYSAAGGDSALVSVTQAGSESNRDYWIDEIVFDEPEKSWSGSYKSAEEMFVLGDTVMVIANCNEYASGYVKGDWFDENRSYVSVDFYDVSDRSNPVFAGSAGQDGYYMTSRLMDGKLYLVTNRYIYTWNEYDEENPSEYVPMLYRGGETFEVAVDRICWPESTTDSSYTVVARYSPDARDLEDSLSVLGAGSTVYMSRNYLYLADSRYFEEARNEWDESVYHVTEYMSGNRTELLKLSVTGAIAIEETGSVDGNLLNQFSMDEYGDTFRVVTTCWNSSYQIWEDAEHGFTNYKYLESGQTNGLYVFDSSMNLTGAVTSLAEGEQVYSVRFDGTVGYFVTFRQVDPLFAVDLSDPANPTVMSALKIPGFSRYLHPWSAGLLLGIGQDADEETGRTGGMKLSMFDTSNPYDVSERDKYILDDKYYSEALYNHKAILAAPNKGLIGFPTDNGYVLFRYEEGSGFSLMDEVKFESDWYWDWNSRGLYVGDNIYIVSSTMLTVLDMNTCDLLVRVDG